MMTIVLDDGLSRLREELEREGFNVVDKSMAGKADALVLSGMDNNVMGMHDIVTTKRVVHAEGKNVSDIVKELRGIQEL